MTPNETIALCRYVKAICPSQALDQYTPDAWHLILGHLEYDDAKLAVTQIASLDLEPGKARYIEPGHILATVKRIRAKRLDDYGPIDNPPAGLNAAEYLTWLRTTRNAIANGQAPQHRQLTTNPAGQARFQALTRRIGNTPPNPHTPQEAQEGR